MIDSILKLLAVVALVLINGLFVAAEFALVSVRPTRIDQLMGEGNRMARVVRRALDDPNRFISAAQVGITVASLGLGWLAEPAVAELIHPLLEPALGDDSAISAHLIAGAIALFIITLLHIVIGEQIPKMIALQRSESTILASAPFVTWIAIPFRPLIALLYWLTSAGLRSLGLTWQGEHHLVYSEDELRMLVTASHQRGFLDESEQEMINRVFSFAELLAEQVMVPRTEIAAIPIDASIDEMEKIVAESGHARFPVYGENLDDIRGVFHAKDLYRLLAKNEQHRFNLRRLVRTPLMVAESTNLDVLLTRMKRERTHVAIVVDEYGGTAGMITLEDVLERIIGEVQDEFETDVADVQELETGETRVSGLLSLDEVQTRFGIALDDPFYNTIGGYVFGQLGRRPVIGDEVEVEGLTLRITALDGLRIDRVEICRNQTEHAEPSETSATEPVSVGVEESGAAGGRFA